MERFSNVLSEEFRIVEGEEPAEEYWEWRDYSVHIDRYVPKENNKRLKVILVHGGGGNGRLLGTNGSLFKSRRI